MLSTVARRVLISALFSVACSQAIAGDIAPRVLQEPVFGLRFEIARAKLDELPAEVLKLCPDLSNEQEQMRLWQYAVAHDAGRTYYVVGGYYIRPDAKQAESPHYVLDTLGAVFYVQGRECKVTGPARETFDARFFEETPQPVLQALAADLAQRLARGFGGANQLATQFRRQHIESATLSPELREAFKRYFKR